MRANYDSLKMLNPSLPILVREGKNIEPKIYLRGPFLQESAAVVSDMDLKQVEEVLRKLAERAGVAPVPRAAAAGNTFRDIV